MRIRVICVIFAFLAALALGARPVTQVVCGADGKPVPHAVVQLVYCAQGTAHLLHATADAAGTATWREVPAVRAIVWGDGVPAGLLAADAVDARGPLPVPPVEGPVSLRLQTGLLYSGDAALPHLVWREGPARASELTGNPIRNGVAVHAGAWLDAVVLYPGTPNRTSMLSCYVPYPDMPGRTVDITPVDGHGVLGAGQFLDAAGHPAAVAHLAAVPVDVPGLPAALAPAFLDDVDATWRDPARKVVDMGFNPVDNGKPLLPLIPVTLEKGGAFTLNVPAPGVYRLLVDLDDPSAPAPPGLLVTVTADAAPLTVTLPAPLFTVPGGTEISAAFKRAPSRVVVLKTAGTAPVPVYGAAAALLACWYQAPETTLHVWQNGKVTDHVQRTVHVRLQDADGNPYPVDMLSPRSRIVELPSPLPVDVQPVTFTRFVNAVYPPDALKALDNVVTLWSGPQVITEYREEEHYSTRTRAQGVTAFTLPAQGGDPQNVALTSPVTLHRPHEAAGKTAELSGQLADAAGKPLARAGLTVARSFFWYDRNAESSGYTLPEDVYPTNVQTSTDANGHFSFADVPVGAVFLTARLQGEVYVWSVTVPATGLTALALAPPTPRVQVLQNFAPKAPVALWYFPAQGAPRQLLSADRAFITARNISQPGLLWASDGTFALLQPIADEPLITMNTGTPAPTLGICCPLSHPVLLPGALTLTGEGARQGFTVTLVHPNWKFAPFLDCCTLQLDAMPEGTYHVTADNPDATYEGTAVVGPSGGYVELAAQ